MKRQHPPQPERPGPQRRSALVLCAVFLLLSFGLYGNTLDNDFVHDDIPLVARNQVVQGPLSLARIFTSGYWTTGNRAVPELYRPLVILTFAMNHAVSGLRPGGYHLGNLLLHAGICILIFWLVSRLGGSHFVAWSTALLFAVHPVHTEAVTPVVGRSETLAALFFLSALLMDRRHQRGDPAAWGKRALWLGGAAACLLAGLLSKEHVVIWPLVVLLLDLLFPVRGGRGARPWRVGAYSLYIALLGGYLALRTSVLGAVANSVIDPLDNPMVTAPFGVAKWTALAALAKNAGLLMWPLHLSADYSLSQFPLATGWSDPRLLGTLAVLVAASGLLLWGWRRSRLTAFGVLFFAVTYLPVSNLLFPIGTLLGERLLYLPSLGVCLVVAVGLGYLKKKKPRLALLALVLLLPAGSLRTIARNGDWQDETRFTLATARQAPKSAKAQHNLGAFWEDRGDLAQAEKGYRKAVELAPDWPDTHYNLAGILGRMGHTEEAISEYRLAIHLDPASLSYRINLGYLLYRNERYAEAVSLYRESLEAIGESAALRTNLGVALDALDRTEEAIAAHRKAVSLDPNNPDYQRNLGEILVRGGEAQEGLKWLRSAVRLRPTADLLAALGISLLEVGQSGEAATVLASATRSDPSEPRYRYYLARALEASGNLKEAEAEYRRVLATTPDAAPPLRDLGLLMAGQGQSEEAISLLERAHRNLPQGLDREARQVLDRLRNEPNAR